MAEHYFIRLGGARPDEAETVALDAEGRVLSPAERIPLSVAAQKAEGYQVTVLLPGDELVTTVANIPTTSPARLRQMLPYSLEDDFAADVDALHFAAGPRNAEGQLAVSVISRSRLEFWLDALKAAGIGAKQVCAETDAVPDTPGVVTLLVEHNRILGRRPGHASFVFSDMALPDLWRLIENESDDKSGLESVMLLIDANEVDSRRSEIDGLRAMVDQIDVKALPDGVVPRLASSLVFHPGTNLLQGAYAPRSNVRALAAPWRVAATLLIAVAGFGLLSQAALYFKLRHDERVLDRQAVEICAQSFGSQDVSRCRVDMQRRLAEAGQSVSGAEQGFLPALGVVATHAEGLTIEQIVYRDRILVLEVLAPSVQRLDTFQRRIDDTASFTAEIQNNRTENDGTIRSRLQVVSRQP